MLSPALPTAPLPPEVACAQPVHSVKSPALTMPELVTLALPPSIHAANAPQLLTQLSRQMDASPATPVIVDAAALRQFDSSAVALLLALRRHAQGSRPARTLRVLGMNASLHALAAVYGVISLLVDEAGGDAVPSSDTRPGLVSDTMAKA